MNGKKYYGISVGYKNPTEFCAHRAFKILEKSFEAPFWDYFVNDSKHNFFKPGSKEERQAFGKATWQQKQEN